MAHINNIGIHGCERISVSEHQDEIFKGEPFTYFVIDFGDCWVTVFDRELEDLRAALYRYDMEVYDAS